MSCNEVIRQVAASASVTPPMIFQTWCPDDRPFVFASRDLAARSCCSLKLVSLILFSLIAITPAIRRLPVTTLPHYRGC
jgi:hypothetical protein